MLDHVSVGVSNMKRSKAFYDAALAPLGMTPNIDQSPLPATVVLAPHTKIYDLVYNPRETKLVRDARAQGLSATTGLGMLIEQAALGFELWTGATADRTVMQQAVI